MTAVVAFVSWVEQWLEVVGGQDALRDLMKSCARDKWLHVSKGGRVGSWGDTRAGGKVRHAGECFSKKESSLTTCY